METYVQIDSICIDLTNYMDNTDPGKCEHFSLRGYVSEMRKKDWKKCWPFPVNESDEKPTLPPLDVPKFRWWACESCQKASVVEGTDKDHRTDLNCSNNGCGYSSSSRNAIISSGIQQTPMPESTPPRREIDLNIPIELSSDSDYEIENNAEVLPSRTTDPAIGLENKFNHQVSSVGSLEVCPGLLQEVKRGKQISQEELSKSCSLLREGTQITQQDNVTENPTALPPKSIGGSNIVPTGNIDKIVNNNCQDHYPERSTGLGRKRRPRKMRLMTNILSENGDPKTEQIAGNGLASHLPSNASATLQTLSILSDKVDIQGDMTLTKKGQGRKRKFLRDEESGRPADMCYQRIENEVQNLEGDGKPIDTIYDNRFKDVHVGKKTRKIQHVDNHLISEPHQGQHRENGDTLDIANNECASKIVSSRLFLHASTEKGMDDFPLHSPRTENVRNSSKGKGKVVQADEELGSLSCWNNDKLVEDTFAHTGAKNMSNMPVSIPFLPAQGAPNGEGPEEGLKLSLSCYPSTDVCNEKRIRKTENWLPSSSPLIEVTSKSQLIRKDSRTNIFKASRDITNALSGKGKGVLLKELNGDTNKDKTAEVMELDGMKRFYDLTMEESDDDTFDDVPNVFPRKENSTNYLYPFAGNRFGVSNLCKNQSPFGFDVLQSKINPSSGVYFSPMDTIRIGPSKFNRRIAESRSSDASLQAKGVPNLLKTILHQGREASHPWPTLGYDVVPRKAVSQPSKCSMDFISLRSGSLHKQIEKKDFDLNFPYLNANDLQNLGRNICQGTLRRMNPEYRFPGKHNAMEACQNPRGSFDMHSNEGIAALNLLGLMDAGRWSATSLNVGVGDQMLKRPSYPGECSTNPGIGKSKMHGSKRLTSDVSSESDGDLIESSKREKSSSSNSAMQTGVYKHLSELHLERETLSPSNNISENLCTHNRNPADFTVPDENNAYMTSGGDLILENSVPENRLGLTTPRACRAKRNQKGKMKKNMKKRLKPLCLHVKAFL